MAKKKKRIAYVRKETFRDMDGISIRDEENELLRFYPTKEEPTDLLTD